MEGCRSALRFVPLEGLSMSNLRPFIIAIAFGIIAVVLVYMYIQKVQNQGPEEIEMARVVRATVTIPARETIRENMIEEIEVPADIVTPETVTELEEILGQVSMTVIFESQTLMTQMFAEETALEDPSRMLEEGERAVTVGVTEVSGLGGNISPGDDVDVLVTILSNEEVGVASTFTILRDIEVIAVGQNIGFDESETQSTGPISKSVTLKVNPASAEILALASEIGSIRLSLRHPDDPFAPASDGTALTEITRYTPTREDLEAMAERQREDERLETERLAARTPVYMPRDTDGDEEFDFSQYEFMPLEDLGPPGITIELIMGGESQIITLEREK